MLSASNATPIVGPKTSYNDVGWVTATYAYIGSGTAVQVVYDEPNIMLDLWGGTTGTFTGFDRFGRIIDQHWKRYGGSPADLDRYQYGYDRNSNRIWKQNMVAVTGFDERYIVDNLNRLTRTSRGTLNGSHVIPGTPPLQLAWTLDPVGNWTAYSEQASGSATLLQTRTASEVNEITGITSYITPTWATPAYDDAGNMTSFPRASSPAGSFAATYDAWNRLMTVKQGANFVAAYAYDGLRRRVVKKSYTGGTLTETRDFYFSDQWQILSEAVGGTTDTTYVWGLRYVDELLWRVQSSTRLYAMQDANFNCTAIGDTSGAVVERYQFDPYGTRIVLNASWSVIGASAYNWVVAHQGLMIENDVGLYNCRYRVYSPMLGVWTQRDLLEYSDGVNLYLYLGGIPVGRLDHTGLISTGTTKYIDYSMPPDWHPGRDSGRYPGPPHRVCGPDVTNWMVSQMLFYTTQSFVKDCKTSIDPVWWRGFIPGCGLYDFVTFHACYIHFADMVRSGGVLDYKRTMNFTSGSCPSGCPGTVTICGSCYNVDTVGNILFGFLGRSMGMDPIDLILFPGLVQEGDTWPMDDPRDTEAIRIGIDMTNSPPLSAASLCTLVSAAGNLNKTGAAGCAGCPFTF